MIGQTISHYRVIERLGEGGMGVVYLAEDTLLGRRVAIKTLTNSAGPGNQHFRTRFLREARAVSALSHPRIAAIHDYGETKDGQPYIVMEYVRGETLGELMLRETMTIPRAVQIIKEVAEALAEAHSLGIIHRDIKPSNVAINHRGEVKVLDFGLAKQLDLGPIDPSDPERPQWKILVAISFIGFMVSVLAGVFAHIFQADTFIKEKQITKKFYFGRVCLFL